MGCEVGEFDSNEPALFFFFFFCLEQSLRCRFYISNRCRLLLYISVGKPTPIDGF